MKAIPEGRDRLQSLLLVLGVGLALVYPCAVFVRLAVQPGGVGLLCLKACIISIAFGGLVLALKAATPAAALCGAMICLLDILGTARTMGQPNVRGTILNNALPPLIVLFVLTFIATWLGRSRKAKAGLAESRKGRNAAQVLANLGAGALVVAFNFYGVYRVFDYFSDSFPSQWIGAMSPVLVLAALCEATADTVSSEIGQALGGEPILITTMRRVESGTDGAITLLGTAAGVIGETIVAAVGLWAMRMSWISAGIAFAGGIAGLLFDSLLGATVERKGWLGNDLVNFSSTVFAVVVAVLLLASLK